MSHPVDQRSPRQPLHPDVSEALIKKLVHTFYDEIRKDETLGPIFNEVINDNWPTHLARMCTFWGAVMLKTGAYKGRPVPKHMAITALKPEHFTKWLALFRSTATEVCAGEKQGHEMAAIFIDRAERIAESLQMSCFFAQSLTPTNAFQNGELIIPLPPPANANE